MCIGGCKGGAEKGWECAGHVDGFFDRNILYAHCNFVEYKALVLMYTM